MIQSQQHPWSNLALNLEVGVTSPLLPCAHGKATQSNIVIMHAKMPYRSSSAFLFAFVYSSESYFEVSLSLFTNLLVMLIVKKDVQNHQKPTQFLCNPKSQLHTILREHNSCCARHGGTLPLRCRSIPYLKQGTRSLTGTLYVYFHTLNLYARLKSPSKHQHRASFSKGHRYHQHYLLPELNMNKFLFF